MNTSPRPSATTIHNTGHHSLLKPGTPNRSTPRLNARRQGGRRNHEEMLTCIGELGTSLAHPPPQRPTAPLRRGAYLTQPKLVGTPQPHPKEGPPPLQATAPPAGETPKVACLHDHSPVQGVDLLPIADEDTARASAPSGKGWGKGGREEVRDRRRRPERDEGE
jgi:hypothetical protein